jgi:hypothetical protein
MKKILNKNAISLRVDKKNRVCITKLFRELPSAVWAYNENGKIIIEPIVEVPLNQLSSLTMKGS